MRVWPGPPRSPAASGLADVDSVGTSHCTRCGEGFAAHYRGWALPSDTSEGISRRQSTFRHGPRRPRAVPQYHPFQGRPPWSSTAVIPTVPTATTSRPSLSPRVFNTSRCFLADGKNGGSLRDNPNGEEHRRMLLQPSERQTQVARLFRLVERTASLIVAYVLLTAGVSHLGNPYYLLTRAIDYPFIVPHSALAIAIILPSLEVVLGICLAATTSCRRAQQSRGRFTYDNLRCCTGRCPGPRPSYRLRLFWTSGRRVNSADYRADRSS